MTRATTVLPSGEWDGAGAIDRVVLDYDHRCRRRIALTTEGGRDVLVDLPHATVLRDGDGLGVEDGGVIAVAAAPEPLAEVTCPDAIALARIAWHLGNRHLPVAIEDGRIRLRRDHVIEDMLAKMGAAVAHVEAPFDPEGGAYGAGAVHGHSH